MIYQLKKGTAIGRFQQGRPVREGQLRVNREIRAPLVRVIDDNGDQLGLMHPREAMQLAMERELDLVEIAPNADPPVCKIVDYGKLRYEQQKRDKVQRKNQQVQQLKEVRLHPRTDTHDVDFKTRHAREFLQEGNKVKFVVVFKGREVTHQQIGRDLLQGIIDALADDAKVEQPIRMEGRNMWMTLAPDSKKKKATA
ncbi:MAG: translation initiation factor IF-3 [Chlorobi bacterium]|nr:MAG: translation initiation factor IF-3 [Chlorobi bacterium OLB7]MBK8910907.1 translation initiation factor IF-3 [Chlorobiota bacterium]MBX7218085.1 translation initiation factor IF-3 [Candidatus Kapabacteria bacterium]